MRVSGHKYSRSAFWERLNTNCLRQYLEEIVQKLVTDLFPQPEYSSSFLQKLEVEGVCLIDSSIVSLWDGLHQSFPGTFFTAGIKWHACVELFSGSLLFSKLEAAKKHDSQVLPPLKLFKQKLLIFDLGYWNYLFLLEIELAGGYFLSRLKSNANLPISQVVSGVGKIHIGKCLTEIPFKKKRGDWIEVLVEKEFQDLIWECRAIGFWNPDQRKYFWYLTNLKAPAAWIYPLYRLRWQIELIFKGWKSSWNAASIPSNEENITQSLILAAIIGQLISHSTWLDAKNELSEEQCYAKSFQRMSKITVVLSPDMITFFLASHQNATSMLEKNIKIFAKELIDPNYLHRKTSLAQCVELMEECAFP